MSGTKSLQSDAVTPSSDDLITLLQEGFIHHQSGRLEEAMSRYEQVLKSHPDHLDALQLTGVLLAQRGQPADAINFFEKAIALNPKQLVLLSNAGRAYFDLGHWEKASLSYSEVMGLDPSALEAQCLWAQCQSNLGHFDEAIQGYQRALDLKQDYPPVLAALANVFWQKEEHDSALDYLDRAIQGDPEESSYHANRALFLLTLERWEAALESVDEALSLDPLSSEAQSYRVVILHALGRIDNLEAISGLERVLALSPSHLDTFNRLGNLYKAQNQTVEALKTFEAAITLDPHHAYSYFNRGTLLNELRRFEEATVDFDAAIVINPQMGEAFSNRVFALMGLNRYEEALASANEAIRLMPTAAQPRLALSLVLMELQRFDEALQSISLAIRFDPDMAEAFSNRSCVFFGLGDLEAAHRDATRAIERSPRMAEAYNGLALIYHEKLDVDAAQANFDKAIALNPELPDAHFNRSLLLMLRGNLHQGAMAYEWRWKSLMRHLVRDFERPLWLGDEGLEGKSLLIACEQGLGDFIQHSRYLPLLAAMASEVIVEAPASLMPLMKTLKGSFRWIERGQPIPPSDLYCPLMSLPLAFKTELSTIPSSIPYLSVLETSQEHWRLNLGPKNRPRIGLVWSGSAEHRQDRKRTIRLKDVLSILDNRFEFHLLQKEVRDYDQDLLAVTPSINVHSEDLQDFGDTAALVAEMDLVISVDTSVAHLTGALGRPLWLLVSFSPDFRWLLDRCDSPWYPSARIFRQSAPGDWATVFRQVELSLKSFSGWQ